MLRNYFIIALRHIMKNKVYAAINILGLVVGLVVYLFGWLLVDYEQSHDLNFKNVDRVYTVGSMFSSRMNSGVKENDGIYTAATPLIEADVPEIEAIARTVAYEFLLSYEDDHYYQKIRFTDPSFTTIFDFDYLEGDASALDDPSGIMLTESIAMKFFGTAPALGKTLIVDHNVSLHVTAVIKDLPAKTHFNSNIIGRNQFEVVAPLAALHSTIGYPLEGNWNNLSRGDLTYILLPQGKTVTWLQSRIDGVYESHFPERLREFIVGMKVRPLVEVNTGLWQQIGIPVLESVQLLALLVLVVALVNYTNLATAQSLGRAREVGLRKTMGAGRHHLLLQFLVESLCIAMLSMLIALVVLEVVVPLFNAATGRALVILYAEILPWLLATTLMVGLVAGSYPAYIITRTSPIEALRENSHSSHRSNLFRSMMLGLQFSISIFMLAMVFVIFLQNQKIEQASNIYPKSQIITLKRLDVESVQARLKTLGNELRLIPGVENVTFSSLVPYEGSNSSRGVTSEKGNEQLKFALTQLIIDESFLETYNIPLLTGRNLSSGLGGDYVIKDDYSANVIVNELALQKLGFASPEDAINGVFYDFAIKSEPRVYTIVGVVPDQNFRGFQNSILPTVYFMQPYDASTARGNAIQYGSIRVSGVSMNSVINGIETTWDAVIPEYPVQIELLEDAFGSVFQIFNASTIMLGGFALIAFTLSIIGLFGLAAFMAESRTKEIGVRKVMGASIFQLVRLMIWQFSQPVVWALVVALPLAYLAAGFYLDLFQQRLDMTAIIVSAAGLLAVILAWGIVALHAIKIAVANPVGALRYE